MKITREILLPLEILLPCGITFNCLVSSNFNCAEAVLRLYTRLCSCPPLFGRPGIQVAHRIRNVVLTFLLFEFSTSLEPIFDPRGPILDPFWIHFGTDFGPIWRLWGTLGEALGQPKRAELLRGCWGSPPRLQNWSIFWLPRQKTIKKQWKYGDFKKRRKKTHRFSQLAEPSNIGFSCRREANSEKKNKTKVSFSENLNFMKLSCHAGESSIFMKKCEFFQKAHKLPRSRFLKDVSANMQIFEKLASKKYIFWGPKMGSKMSPKSIKFWSDFRGSFFGGHFWTQGQFSRDVSCETHGLGNAFLQFCVENGFQTGPENQLNSKAKFQQKNNAKKGAQNGAQNGGYIWFDTWWSTVGRIKEGYRTMQRTSKEKNSEKNSKKTGSTTRA